MIQELLLLPWYRPPIHIGNIPKEMIPQTGANSNAEMPILPYFMRFFKDRDMLRDKCVSVEHIGK